MVELIRSFLSFITFIMMQASTKMLCCRHLRWHCQHRMELQCSTEHSVVADNGLCVVLAVQAHFCAHV